MQLGQTAFEPGQLPLDLGRGLQAGGQGFALFLQQVALRGQAFERGIQLGLFAGDGGGAGIGVDPIARQPRGDDFTVKFKNGVIEAADLAAAKLKTAFERQVVFGPVIGQFGLKLRNVADQVLLLALEKLQGFLRLALASGGGHLARAVGEFAGHGLRIGGVVHLGGEGHDRDGAVIRIAFARGGDAGDGDRTAQQIDFLGHAQRGQIVIKIKALNDIDQGAARHQLLFDQLQTPRRRPFDRRGGQIIGDLGLLDLDDFGGLVDMRGRKRPVDRGDTAQKRDQNDHARAAADHVDEVIECIDRSHVPLSNLPKAPDRCPAEFPCLDQMTWAIIGRKQGRRQGVSGIFRQARGPRPVQHDAQERHLTFEHPFAFAQVTRHGLAAV